VFVDIDPVTKNLDPELLEKALTEKTRAVIAVHLYGRAADVATIRAVCDPRGVPVIEDACQAIGARFRGHNVGTLGTMACFSFFPSKNLGGAGDGGFLTTDDAALAAKVKLLRNHGQSDAYRHEIVGANFRLDALQAAILRVKLRHLETWIAARRANALRYGELLRAKGLDGIVRTPPDDADRHVYHQYVIDVPERDRLLAVLKERGIGCAIYYPIPFHQQPCFAEDVRGQGPFPESLASSRTGLALPIFPELTGSEIQEVVAAIAAALA
jgi:dTDP-4-amino-4,6-dideoxygalactose transaminase